MYCSVHCLMLASVGCSARVHCLAVCTLCLLCILAWHIRTMYAGGPLYWFVTTCGFLYVVDVLVVVVAASNMLWLPVCVFMYVYSCISISLYFMCTTALRDDRFNRPVGMLCCVTSIAHDQIAALLHRHARHMRVHVRSQVERATCHMCQPRFNCDAS